MFYNQPSIIRSITKDDIRSINQLVQFGAHVHRHLDWRQPSEWIGQKPFLVAEWNYQLLAALACPPDTGNVAWIRLFAVNSMVNVEDSWKALWDVVKENLATMNTKVAVLGFHEWFKDILDAGGFESKESVILLQWDHGSLPPKPKQSEVTIRRMTLDDLPIVQRIDQAAFEPLWQQSLALLEVAFIRSSLATVAETAEGIVGYQISTANASSGHLARLAVLPEWQGRGIGYSLIHHTLSMFSLWGALRVTVNTQTDNYSSLAVYRKVGFRKTDDIYPVYLFNH